MTYFGPDMDRVEAKMREVAATYGANVQMADSIVDEAGGDKYRDFMKFDLERP
jgi:hypothetical protein